MAGFDYDIGIIGGGAAGLTVASGAAQLGAAAVLIEKAPQLGGDCLHTGCVPSKTLIKSAAVYWQMRNATRYGLPEVELPPVDFAAISRRIQEVIKTIQPHDSPERFCKLGAQTLFGTARFVDEQTVEVTGEDGTKTITAHKWVIATGSVPSAPPIPGLADVPYLTNETVFSQTTFPRSLVILGGGPIAIEMAQAFQRLGSSVRVIQRSASILRREEPELAEMVRAQLASEGVEVFTETETSNVAHDADGYHITIHQGGTERTVHGDALLVALGRTPDLTSLQLENAGVEYTAKGVTVDERLRTNKRHIFACGDCIGQHQFTHAAGYEGGVVLTNALFRIPRSVDYTWLPRVTYCDPELAAMGMTEQQARDAGKRVRIHTEHFHENDRAQAEGETEGVLKLVTDHKERILGVSIYGPHAGELLGEWVAITNGSVSLTTLAGATHPYPTLAEINKKVASSIIASKIFSGFVPKVLDFVFNLKGRACTPEKEGKN